MVGTQSNLPKWTASALSRGEETFLRTNILDITYFVTDFELVLFYRTSYRNVSSGAHGPSHNNSVTPRADNLVPPTLHPHPSLNIASASLSSHIIISHLTISHNRIPPSSTPPQVHTFNYPTVRSPNTVTISQICMMSLEERSY